MGILKRESYRTNSYHKQDFIKEVRDFTARSYLGKDERDEVNLDDVYSYLFEHQFEDKLFSLVKYDPSTSTIMNRVNLLWVYPLFLIAALPVYLLKGTTGVSRDGRFGRIVHWLIKLD